MASFEWPPVMPVSSAPAIGWQCPGCKTHYAPGVLECRCEAASRPLDDRIAGQPPIRLGSGQTRIQQPPEVVITA